mmetsp:Transcript_93512/g.268077  ORF Transcript_93512/g.268077 Transcript_93512/m.268077 type:complete len:202 (+) Transcript_93512:133-738(+)
MSESRRAPPRRLADDPALGLASGFELFRQCGRVTRGSGGQCRRIGTNAAGPKHGPLLVRGLRHPVGRADDAPADAWAGQPARRTAPARGRRRGKWVRAHGVQTHDVLRRVARRCANGAARRGRAGRRRDVVAAGAGAASAGLQLMGIPPRGLPWRPAEGHARGVRERTRFGCANGVVGLWAGNGQVQVDGAPFGAKTCAAR